MNRREALIALAGVVASTGLTVTPLKTTDAAGLQMVVLRSPGRLSEHMIARLRDHWRDVVRGTALAHVPIVLLGDGMDLGVGRVRPDGTVEVST